MGDAAVRKMLSDFDLGLIQLMADYLTASVWDGDVHTVLLAEMASHLSTVAEELEEAIAPYDYCWWIAQWQVGLIGDIDYWVTALYEKEH